MTMEDQFQSIEANLHLKLLHGNFLAESAIAQERLAASLRTAALEVPTQALRRGLDSGDWRSRLRASWLIGVRRDMSFLPEVSERLLASDTCFAGQGLCFALARLEQPDALIAYLDEYLPVGERQYDQLWAIGALAWLDASSGTEHCGRFRDPNLWALTGLGRVIGQQDPEAAITMMARLMSFADAHWPND